MDKKRNAAGNGEVRGGEEEQIEVVVLVLVTVLVMRFLALWVTNLRIVKSGNDYKEE